MTPPRPDNAPGFDADALRRKALRRLQDHRPPVAEMGADELTSLIHELEVHQVELEVQNEELRRAQVELADARNRYLELYEFAPVGYLTLDGEGVVRQANLSAGRICARERGRIVGRRLERLLASEDRDACYLLLRNAATAEEAEPVSYKVRLGGKGGAPRRGCTWRRWRFPTAGTAARAIA